MIVGQAPEGRGDASHGSSLPGRAHSLAHCLWGTTVKGDEWWLTTCKDIRDGFGSSILAAAGVRTRLIYRMLTELMIALKKQLTEKLLPMPAQLCHVLTGLLLVNEHIEMMEQDEGISIPRKKQQLTRKQVVVKHL